MSKRFVKIGKKLIYTLVILWVGVVIGSGIQQFTIASDTEHQESDNSIVYSLWQEANDHRMLNNRRELSLNGHLNKSALAKCEDMVAKDYWNHISPSGEQPWIFIDSTGYDYKSAGENQAYGFVSPEDTVDGWINSEAHNKNLLDDSFTEVGYGVCRSDDFNNSGQQTVIVQHLALPQ